MTDKWDQITGYCCGTCRYYAPKDSKLGRCRRNAPQMAGYPVVYPYSDWCGEHKIGTNPTKHDSEKQRKATIPRENMKSAVLGEGDKA